MIGDTSTGPRAHPALSVPAVAPACPNLPAGLPPPRGSALPNVDPRPSHQVPKLAVECSACVRSWGGRLRAPQKNKERERSSFLLVCVDY